MALITAPSQRSTQSSIWNLQLPAETVSETNTSPRGTHQTTRRQKETGLCFPHTGDGNCPRLLLIERWVANEAGHTALSLETQRHRSTPTSHPLSPEVERGEREKDREFCLGGYECGSWVPPKPPVSWLLLSTVWAHKGCAGKFAGHQGQCDTLCKLVWPSFTSVLCFSVIPLTKLRSCRCYKLWVFDFIYRGQGDTD